VAVAAFVCIGHLNAVCADVCRVLQPGGRVGFSVDQAKDTEDRQRWPSSRYAQSAHYPKSLPRGRGFTRPQQSRVPCATSNNSPWQSSRPTPAC
jgi:predicted TPR repeat methyltransferase